MVEEIIKCSSCPWQFKLHYGTCGQYEWACGRTDRGMDCTLYDGKSANVIPPDWCPLRIEEVTIKLKQQ